MNSFHITKEQARRFLLSYQGLLPPHQLVGKSGILDFIKRVGCIQFDPLNVAGPNHELVLQSRILNFDPKQLQELLYEDRKLLDGWDKNMSIYSIEDWPYFRRFRDNNLNNLGNKSRPALSVIPEIRKALEERGPLSSSDLKFDKTVDWFWAPTSISRAALESMYFWGELIVHHKVNTRRVYDFSTKLIPRSLLNMPDPNISEEEFFTWYIKRRLGSVGLLWNKASDAWLGMPRLKNSERNKIFEALCTRNEIYKIDVEGISTPLYIQSSAINTLQAIIDTKFHDKRASIIAPLDNLIWDRKLIKELFNFEYVWEVYKPQDQRQYGYYVLPVLYGDRFIARFEPLRDKKSKSLSIKNWWWEPDIIISEEIEIALSECFRNFLYFLKVNKIKIDKKVVKNNSLKWLSKVKI